MNRALVIQSFNPALRLQADSAGTASDDVALMQAGLLALKNGRPIECGHAGTVLRFLALRAAREKGRFHLQGSERLFQRPQKELIKVLSQLGSQVSVEGSGMTIQSDGWRLCGDGLWVSGGESSQFASAVLLSAWDLPFELHLSVGGVEKNLMVSRGYFEMTLQMVRSLGMSVMEGHPGEYSIPAKQKVSDGDYTVECDVSSAFAVAALAAVGGECRIRNFPSNSLQPDAIFIRYLIEMGVPLRQQPGEGLFVGRGDELKAIQADLMNSPDLFPVLASLCVLADGPSQFTGIHHLRHKESDRIEKTAELLRLVGGDLTEKDGKLTVYPISGSLKGGIFHPDQDHRMAMAASVLIQAGAAIEITTPEVVNKSFPDFWQFAPWKFPA